VSLREGDRIGRFRLGRAIARGRSGVVFRASDDRPARGSTREAAVKVIDGIVLDARARERIIREASVLHRLRHPNVAALREAGFIPDGAYIAMDLVEGWSIAELIAGRPLPVAETVRIAIAVAGALEAAHAAGVVHRDVKPANVRVEAESGQVVLVDFGLAALADASTLTASHASIGTPAYMPPEQADPGGGHGAVGPPSDVYALGCMLFEMLTGERAFPGATPFEVVRQHLTEPAPSPRSRRPDVPPALDAIVLRCLEKRPALRYPDAGALRADLERLRRGRRVDARTRWPRPVPRLAAWIADHPGAVLAATAAVTAALSVAATLRVVARPAAPPAAAAARGEPAPAARSAPAPGAAGVEALEAATGAPLPDLGAIDAALGRLERACRSGDLAGARAACDSLVAARLERPLAERLRRRLDSVLRVHERALGRLAALPAGAPISLVLEAGGAGAGEAVKGRVVSVEGGTLIVERDGAGPQRVKVARIAPAARAALAFPESEARAGADEVQAADFLALCGEPPAAREAYGRAAAAGVGVEEALADLARLSLLRGRGP